MTLPNDTQWQETADEGGPKQGPARASGKTFSVAALAGGRYRIVHFLAHGAMGEVYEAEDLELGERVALKTIRHQASGKDRVLERFKREIRLARKVTHPNVCRIFDLGLHRSVSESAEAGPVVFLTMELLQGETLAQRLERTGPMTEAEALPLIRQMADGLGAAHRAGVVHRDFKSANVLLCEGRLVITDFGLAQGGGADQSQAPGLTGTAALVGTPAYMAPEQVAGEPITAAADLYALGVVMYEMLTGTWPFCGDLQAVLLRRLAQPAPSPRTHVPELDQNWEAAILRCLEREPAARFRSTAELIAMLEGREARPPAAVVEEDPSPYPGLAAFTEADADLFFGREEEVEVLCEKLRRNRLLAIIGPSGVGKSSFLRAGLLPALPPGWSSVVCHPGQDPFAELAHALAPELAGSAEPRPERIDGPEAGAELFSRWRRRHAEVLLVVDQFEELFTLNGPEAQSRFAELLGGTALECGVRVLISMRDDFLFQCHASPALRPVYSDLTPLAPPAGAALRRALVQPALRCGFRFEDEALVEEMLDEVRSERGALPLLAFAASRLWDARDRERRLLTREAYRRLGGVSGALAQHAESALGRIGAGREGMVREVFRNLVTAEGTRGVRDADELLSVFGDRKGAAEVLRALVDARLLVSYEAASDSGSAGRAAEARKIEIVHESLLSAWPRLVLWRTQDAEGALLRDELRQAARLWEARRRPAELLWSGASLDEFRLWRKRYPGGLSTTEEAFARAMLDAAARGARRRRLAIAGVIGALLFVLAGMSYLYRESEGARRQAASETRRAEASRLLALGRLALVDNSSAAVAFALASLELADDPVGRRFALEALWRGPTALAAAAGATYPWDLAFSPDGRWLAAAMQDGSIWLWPRDGAAPTKLEERTWAARRVAFLSDGAVLVSESRGTLQFWSVVERRLTRTIPLHGFVFPHPDGTRVITVSKEPEAVVQSWPLDGGPPATLGHLQTTPLAAGAIQDKGQGLVLALGPEVGLFPLQGPQQGQWLPLGRHDKDIWALALSPGGDRIASGDRDGEVRLWSISARSGRPEQSLSGQEGLILELSFSPDGGLLASASADGTVCVWNVASGSVEDPLTLRIGKVAQMNSVAFDPSGQWLATAANTSLDPVQLWPLTRTYPRVFRGHGDAVQGLAFDPAGSWLASASWDGTVRRWPLKEGAPDAAVLLRADTDFFWRIGADPLGRSLIVSAEFGSVRLVPTTGGPPRVLSGFTSQAMAVAFSPDGHVAAAAGGQNSRRDAVIRLWDPEGRPDPVRVLDSGDGMLIEDIAFAPDRHRFASAGVGGVRLWDLQGAEGNSTLLAKGNAKGVEFSPDGRCLLGVLDNTLVLHSFEDGVARPLQAHGTQIGTAAFHPSGGLVASGDLDGVVRVGPITGEEPHLLLGHADAIDEVAVHPKGDWIASSSKDKTVRLWRLPHGQPFHTLPYEEFLTRLRALTNLRVVRDGEDPSGYRLALAAFPGWAAVPVW